MIETRNRVVLWFNPTIAVSDYVFRVVARHKWDNEVSTKNYSQRNNSGKLWTYFAGSTDTFMDSEYGYSCFDWYDRLRAR